LTAVWRNHAFDPIQFDRVVLDERFHFVDLSKIENLEKKGEHKTDVEPLPYPIKDDGTDGQDGQQESTPLDLDGDQDMFMGPCGDASRITLSRMTRFGSSGFLKGHSGDIHKGRQVHQEGWTDHGNHGIKEGFKDGIHRDQTEIGKFKFNLVQTEDDGHDDGRIPPAEGVQDIIPVREKVGSPDGVEVQVEDEGSTPAAGG
jgi:hypothetical protein